MIAQRRDRRDWTLLIFIIPIAVILMCIAGQLAIRILPRWSVEAGMESNLDPNAPAQPFSIFQPILPQILTPMGWADVYLTPGSEIVFPPFFIFTPPGASATPVPATPTQAVSPTGSLSPSPTTTVAPSPSRTPTSPSGLVNTATPTPEPPTATPTPEPPTATPTPAGNPSTPPPGHVPIPPPPGAQDPPDGVWHTIPNNSYFVLDISATPIIVDGDSDWDLVFYERMNGPGIYLDNIIIGISKESDGSIYYVVFNWGDYAGTPLFPTNDLNTNISHIIEMDNAWIPQEDLYNNTGILINVDGAASQPPPGIYNYIIVLSGLTNTDLAEIDSIQIFPPP